MLDLPKDFGGETPYKDINKDYPYDDLKRVKTYSNQKSRGSLSGIDQIKVHLVDSQIMNSKLFTDLQR